jgi:pimeloyl-ACP methyl ester carboxylesterase
MERSMEMVTDHKLRIPVGSGFMAGELCVPEDAGGVVVFAHGSGSSRHSPRYRLLAAALQEAGFATLLVDLPTPPEQFEYEREGQSRFAVCFLAERLLRATEWLCQRWRIGDLPFGYFGDGIGTAAALVASVERPEAVSAIISRGGRPDLAGPALSQVTAATLLIVGSADRTVACLNERALTKLDSACVKELHLVPGASHLFSEPGALQEVSRAACAWFQQHLRAPVLTSPIAALTSRRTLQSIAG